MLFWLLLFIQIICSLAAAEEAIKKNPEGKKILDYLSKAGLFFLHSRANPDYMKDLRSLSKLFGIIVIVLLVFYFVFDLYDNYKYNTTLLIFAFMWLSFRVTTNFKKNIFDNLSLCVQLAVLPWIILLLDVSSGSQSQLWNFISAPFDILGIQDWQPYKVAILISAVLVIFGIFYTIVSTLFLSIIPLFILFIIICVSKASQTVLRLEPKVLNYIAIIAIIYSICVGPTLLALEAKGII